MPEDEFDWSLGVTDGDATETTPVAERGAHLAETNQLDVQSQAPEQGEDGDDADAGGETEQQLRAAAGTTAEQSDAGDAGEDNGAGEQSDQQLILGKFKTPADLAKAYQELEQFKGQQGNEVGQLRDKVSQMEGYIASIQQQTSQAPITEDLVSQVDDLASSNPQGAAMWALEHQPMLYNRVMQVWAANDPLSAGRFENALMREQLKQEMTETITQQYGPVAQTVTEQTQATQFDTAWRSVAAKFPDFKTFESGLMDAASSAPELAQALQTGDVASKERLIENLYWLTKGRQADTALAAAADLGKQQQQEAVAAKLGATVASGSSAQARGEKTNIETWKEQFLEAPSTSIVDNLRERASK